MCSQLHSSQCGCRVRAELVKCPVKCKVLAVNDDLCYLCSKEISAPLLKARPLSWAVCGSPAGAVGRGGAGAGMPERCPSPMPHTPPSLGATGTRDGGAEDGFEAVSWI